MNTYGRYPLTIVRGQGALLYDDNNKEYIDNAAGIATCCLGHAHPRLTQAIVNQMSKLLP